ncbi:conserved uncharacterized protein [Stigmatella aurantiaca DW4/3-1]|uniref:Conserved uncharacterized protein n=1 Tax=Stigmatella aurantiaca (strain DW4/3-1) TaxID=378806 RepID=E3FWS3_STIAD|nr:conserved uncharacterized protein [Stigmatella aurantiaca DW4/3-1]
MPTVLLFPADIQKKTITVDQSRIRVVDTGARSIIVQAVEDYRPNERQELEVYFADGKSPARAAFVLVMDPAEVDTRIDVERPEPPNGACPVEVQQSDPQPEDFVLLGYVNESGVPTAKFDEATDDAQGLKSDAGVSYRGNGWVLFDIVIRNLSGRPSFAPHEATLRGKDGVTLRALRVTAERDTIAPGESARVLVMADVPPPSAGLVFTLEVLGAGGRSVVIPRVTLPTAAPEGKR